MKKIYTLDGTIIKFESHGKLFNFFVENKLDLIQKHHLSGCLYEKEELSLMSKYLLPNSVVYDIGANVGNHAIFFATVLASKKVICFEANPITAQLLQININLNSLNGVINTEYLGIGLGDALGLCEITYPQVNNIGASQLSKSVNGITDSDLSTVIMPLDRLNIKDLPNFIKIDVEGMEVQVLNGMSNIIAMTHPTMFIEVDNKNRDAFNEWIAKYHYEIMDSYKRYPSNENFLIKYVP